MSFKKNIREIKMKNILFIMFFSGLILLYIDHKMEEPKIEKENEKKKEEIELHKRITERYSGSANIFRPMFNTNIEEMWLSTK